jgi:hypothetical protein
MSLIEKLKERKTEKIQREKETEKKGKLQTMEQINAEIVSTQAKKEKIIALKESLQNNYTGANKKLENFKTQKETLKGTYEENKDILEEDGIENFEGMLEANNEEPEVKQYRKSGGRAPSKESGAIGISSEYAGKTGELYQAVGTLTEIKNSLNQEMGLEKNEELNFSAVTKKDETISNRESSFIKIDEYLKSLDTNLAELVKQKEAVYLETPEGKREALLKIDNPKDKLSSVDFHKIDSFYFSSQVLELSEKIGPEIIKDEYGYELRDKLWLIAWKKKSLNTRDQYNNKSPEQTAIESCSELKKIDELRYNHEDLNKFDKLHNEALNHLEKIFQEDEEVYDKLVNYGLSSGGRAEYEKKQNDGWSNKRIVADRLIKNLSWAADLGYYDNLIKELTNSQEKIRTKNFSNGNITNPEHLLAKLELHNKLLEYIKNNTDKNTEFVNFSNRKQDLSSKLQNDKEFRKELGLTDKLPTSELNVPIDFINRNGGFYEALSSARKYNDSWQEEKNKLVEISTAAVDSRFAQDWERYFSNKHRDFLSIVDYNKKLEEQIQYTLGYLKNSSLLNTPEFANRRIKLSKPEGGYNNNSIIKDLSQNDDYNKYSKAGEIIRPAIEEYANNKKRELEKKMGSLWNIPGRQKKMDALNKQWQVFEDFRNNKPLNDKVLTELGITEEEVTEMKNHRQKRNDNETEYKESDKVRLNFLHATEAKNFFINFKSGDILDGQEMTIEELPARLETRLNEIKQTTANFSEPELAIITERDRAVADVKTTMDKFQKTAINNAEVLRKYKA